MANEEVPITKKPTVAPQSIRAKWDFENNKIIIGWMIPVAARQNRNDRWTSIDLHILPNLVARDKEDNRRQYEYTPKTKVESTEGDRESVVLNDYSWIHVKGLGFETSFEQTYDPHCFFPDEAATRKLPRLSSVVIRVIGHNPKGDIMSSFRLELTEPYDPIIDVPTYDPETNIISAVLHRPPETWYDAYGYRNGVYYARDDGGVPSWNPQWTANLYRVLKRTSDQPSKRTELVPWRTTPYEEQTIEADVSDWISVDHLDTDWIEIQFHAISVGMAGSRFMFDYVDVPFAGKKPSFFGPGLPWFDYMTVDFSKYGGTDESIEYNKEPNVKYFYLAYPLNGRITEIVASSNNYANGFLTIHVELDPNGYILGVEGRKVVKCDAVKLQKLYDTDARTAEAAAAMSESDWTDVTTITGKSVKGFVDSIAASVPQRNNRTWYRVVTYFGPFHRYGVPVEAVVLRRESAIVTSDELIIDEVVPGDDGLSLDVRFHWTTDIGLGTEISWSESPNAWESTQPPSTYDVPVESDSVRSGHLLIRGLTEATKYYIKARRYSMESGTTVYGRYVTAPGAYYPIAPVTKPKDVKLVVPSYVAAGSDIPCYWTFQSNSKQTAWELFAVVNNERKLVASGKDALGSTTLSYSSLVSNGVVPSADDVPYGYSIDLLVGVTTGGDYAYSENATTKVARSPVVSIGDIDDVESLPIEIELYSDLLTTDFTVKVCSDGVESFGPEGDITQPIGSILWADKQQPPMVWDSDEQLYKGTVSVNVQGFQNHCRYYVRVVGTDYTTKLQSLPAVKYFTIDWAHTAPSLEDLVTIVPSVEDKTVKITAQKPETASDDDVVDIYRVTPDDVMLIGEGLNFDVEYTDEYPPFSKFVPLMYRVAIRTTDGDVSWFDASYVLRGFQLRFDWDGRSLELPYNLTVKDKKAKNMTVRRHFDGSENAFWSKGSSMSSTMTSELIALQDPGQIELVKRLGDYAGPVMVRVPDGSAYAADVQVNDLGYSYKDLTLSVSLAVRKIKMGTEFMIDPTDTPEISEG